MLHAIGIYVVEEDASHAKKLKKVKCAQQEKQESINSNDSSSEESKEQKTTSTLLFFLPQRTPINQLKNVDDLLLNSDYYQTEMKPGLPYKFKAGPGEINYIFQPSGHDFILVISSRTKLDPFEKGNLFRNIQHVYLRPDSVKTTLDDIIANPLGYTGRDILIGRIHKELDEVMVVMHDNIEKTIKRGESLDELESKALNLSEHSLEFKKTAERLNSGCCGLW